MLDYLEEAANADAGMRVWASPAFKNPVDGIADFLTLRLRSGADLFQQVLSALCLQGGLQCLR